MTTRYRFALFLLAGLCLILGAGTGLLAKDPSRERFTLKSEDGKTTYIIDAWLPQGYLAHPRPYPLLLMLDGEYAFNSCVQVSEALQRNGEVREFIIVGVSYGVEFGPPLAGERTRDFTPPMDGDRSIRKTETAYYRFIRDRLLPRLQKKYQVAPGQRTLWGYSLSGSFATWLNYFDPTLFDHTIVASGNLMDFGIMQNLFQGRIFSDGKSTGRHVLLSYDASEIPDPKIVEDGRKLLANPVMFPGYKLSLFLTKGESHASSWFASLPAALRFVYAPGSAPTAQAKPGTAVPATPASQGHP